MMNVFRMGSRMLQRTSPWGLIAAGVALAVTLPPVRKGLRCAAIVTTRGILTVADQAREFAANLQEQAEDIVAEARYGDECDMQERWDDVLDTARDYHRDLAVSAATAGLAVSEHVGEHTNAVKKHARAVKVHVQGIVEEAKTRRGSRITSPVNNIEPTNVETRNPEEEKGI
jgi:hypothetical protein